MDEHDENEKRERVLLRPWLENLIDGRSIPGLEWMDDMKTTFKVPWKHRSKKTWSLRHSSIFLEWAKNTGRWSEGDPEPNYAQLKTRLRCAFNKAPDIEEMKELHRTKSEEPYKVYKFIPRKESKLYPFGRRPLRKTTVPITVRRRRYLVSRICSANVGGRYAMSDRSTIHRVKEEKQDVTDMNCAELAADRGFGVATDSKDWTHSTWLTEEKRAAEMGAGGAWPTMYDPESDSQTVNRILPLIVEEENFNSCTSFDLNMPTTDHDDQDQKTHHPITPQMNGDSGSSLQDKSMLSIPKLLRDDQTPAFNVGFPFYQTILPSSIRAPEKREFYDDAHRHQGSATIYVSSPLVDRPRSDSLNSGDNQRILPYAEDYLQNQAARYRGAKQSPACSTSFLAPDQWVSRVTENNRQQMKKRSYESSVIQERPVAPVEQFSDNFHREPVPERRTKSLLPAARLFPLKNRYIMSQNAFCGGREVLPDGDTVQGQRQNAIVKPNVVAQPPIAVATPYDEKPSAEDESLSTAGGISENTDRELLKKYIDSSEVDGQSTEMEVIDLSTKLSSDLESKVLDLTKKMVVTPFERDCRVNLSPGVSKGSQLDIGKETGDILLPSDPAVLPSTVTEILRFKADYKRKKQMIVSKTMQLVEKERELKAREKQLAAREEALFWKENYLHKVMTGTDVGAIPSTAAAQHGVTGPFNSPYDASLPVGFNKMKDGILLPTVQYLKQSSQTVMSAMEAAAIRHQFPVSALTRPDHPGFMPSYHMNSRPPITIRPNISSAASGPPASLFSHGAVSVSMSGSRMGEVGGQNLIQKAVGCAVLPPVKRSIGNETTDPGFEPEVNVALGDANPGRKSYCFSTEKTESESAVALRTVEEEQNQSLMMVRKRGRPKGSKNKNKLSRFGTESSSAYRQMPPLLIIQSPSALKDSSSSDPCTPKSFPFHFSRNTNIPGTSFHSYKSADVSSTLAGMQTMESSSEPHPTTIGSSGSSASRILPPVTPNSIGEHSSPHYGVPTPEVSNSTPVTSVSYSFFDHLPNREIMPETVRQLLMSASKPVSNILPPLSPPKSPEEFSHAILADPIDLCNEEASADENRIIKSVV